MTAIAALFAALAGMLLLAAVAHDRVAYAPLRRALRAGALDATPFGALKTWRGAGMAEHPEAVYRYVAYDVPRGTTAVVRGRLRPDARYFSVALYDRWLQTSIAAGPTYLSSRGLRTDADGAFVLVLAHADPGVPWLDVSAAPQGVLFERHLGGAPATPSTLDRRL